MRLANRQKLCLLQQLQYQPRLSGGGDPGAGAAAAVLLPSTNDASAGMA